MRPNSPGGARIPPGADGLPGGQAFAEGEGEGGALSAAFVLEVAEGVAALVEEGTEAAGPCADDAGGVVLPAEAQVDVAGGHRDLRQGGRLGVGSDEGDPAG